MSRIPLADTGANLRELKPYWLVAAIISFCILAQYVNYRILMNAAGRHLADWRLFAICVIDFAPWIILAPIIARTAGKYAPVSLRPVIFFHLPASVFCAVSVLCLTTLSRFYLEPSDISFGERLSRRLY